MSYLLPITRRLITRSERRIYRQRKWIVPGLYRGTTAYLKWSNRILWGGLGVMICGESYQIWKSSDRT